MRAERRVEEFGLTCTTVGRPRADARAGDTARCRAGTTRRTRGTKFGTTAFVVHVDDMANISNSLVGPGVPVVLRRGSERVGTFHFPYSFRGAFLPGFNRWDAEIWNYGLMMVHVPARQVDRDTPETGVVTRIRNRLGVMWDEAADDRVPRVPQADGQSAALVHPCRVRNSVCRCSGLPIHRAGVPGRAVRQGLNAL
jgi:hypothetical protein